MNFNEIKTGVVYTIPSGRKICSTGVQVQRKGRTCALAVEVPKTSDITDEEADGLGTVFIGMALGVFPDGETFKLRDLKTAEEEYLC